MSNDGLPKNQAPILRLTTMPNDANANGDIFGGWLMSQIDIAGAIIAIDRAKGPVSTVAVSYLRFLKPLFVHDLVSFYGKLIKTGTTSLTVQIDVYAERLASSWRETVKIAEAEFTYVAISSPGVKRVLPD